MEPKMCDVCGENPAGPHGEICADCSVLALRAYGWVRGPDGTLVRGPDDESAQAARARLKELMARKRDTT